MTAANVHDLTPAPDLLHGEKAVVFANAVYHGNEHHFKVHVRGIGFRFAIRPGKRRALPDTPKWRVDDLIKTAKAHFCAKVEHQSRVIKRHFGFHKTRLRGMLKKLLLQGQYAGSPLEPIHGAFKAPMQGIIRAAVCPF